MTPQLRTAVDAASPEHVETARRLLMEAGELHHADEDPRSVLFAALSLALSEPTSTPDAPSTYLVGAYTAVGDPATLAVMAELSEPLGDPAADMLCAALARELAAAAFTALSTRDQAANELEATDGVPQEWL